MEKISKGSLDSTPSPSLSVIIPIVGGKVSLRCRGKTLLGIVDKLLKTKFVDNPRQCFTFTPQANFSAHNLHFHWRWKWWDWIQAIFLNLFYFMKKLQKSYLQQHFFGNKSTHGMSNKYNRSLANTTFFQLFQKVFASFCETGFEALLRAWVSPLTDVSIN